MTDFWLYFVIASIYSARSMPEWLAGLISIGWFALALIAKWWS